MRAADVQRSRIHAGARALHETQRSRSFPNLDLTYCYLCLPRVTMLVPSCTSGDADFRGIIRWPDDPWFPLYPGYTPRTLLRHACGHATWSVTPSLDPCQRIFAKPLPQNPLVCSRRSKCAPCTEAAVLAAVLLPWWPLPRRGPYHDAQS